LCPSFTSDPPKLIPLLDGEDPPLLFFVSSFARNSREFHLQEYFENFFPTVLSFSIIENGSFHLIEI
jgi:hypothetical protein